MTPSVINKETSVKTSVGETIVTRGYDFLPPDARKTMGSLYVPILRISIIQLELANRALERDFFEKRNVGEHDVGTPLWAPASSEATGVSPAESRSS